MGGGLHSFCMKICWLLQTTILDAVLHKISFYNKFTSFSVFVTMNDEYITLQ